MKSWFFCVYFFCMDFLSWLITETALFRGDNGDLNSNTNANANDRIITVAMVVTNSSNVS